MVTLKDDVYRVEISSVNRKQTDIVINLPRELASFLSHGSEKLLRIDFKR